MTIEVKLFRQMSAIYQNAKSCRANGLIGLVNHHIL